MKDFGYQLRGETSPHGRQRVYFTSHPDDFDLYFEEISQIVLKKFDCAIWYFRDDPDDEDEYSLRISEMQLFIIPITKNFLMTPNRARDIDLPYALKHNIPILPLMQTSGLDEPFARICGNLHYIEKNKCDVTTLTYEQKIQKFLSFILVNDELLLKIRQAFYARIFLSYRKKDRALANRLMELIHDIPFCRDISIWFDEYLLPGEDFNDAIINAMKNSQLFVLCVTENLVNEDNYIRKTEYPKARELSLPIMPILSAALTDDQMNSLKNLYDDIPEIVDGFDPGQLTNSFYTKFTDIAMSEKTEDPMHLFFIGLAYLNGIEVEINHNRAAELITKAADRNYLPAIEQLATMYRIGEGVMRNPEKALELYEKQIKILSESAEDKKLYEALYDLLKFLYESDFLFRYKHFDCVKRSTIRIAEIAANIELGMGEYFKMFSLLAFVNVLDDDICNMFVKSALEYLPRAYGEDERMLSEEAFFYSRLASLYYQRSAGYIVYNVSANPVYKEQRKQSETYIMKSIDLLEALYRKDPIKWKGDYAEVLSIFCSMNYSQPFCDDRIIVKNMELAIRLYRELCEDNELLYAVKLAALCLQSGDYLAFEIDFLWEKALGICLDLDSEKYISEAPEQGIPLRISTENSADVYDIRRIRKALSLMRYSTALYEAYAAKGYDDCWLELAQAYSCLSRLLSCLSVWIEDVQENRIEEIRMELLKDCCKCYQRMLAVLRTFTEKYPEIKYKSQDYCDLLNAGDDALSDEALNELEHLAYEKDPFAECYNFAVQLYENDLDEESLQLHTDLYYFFKEVYPNADAMLVLMNLYVYACSKEHPNEILAVLLEFEDDKQTTQDKLAGSRMLFDYYLKVAQCYLEMADFCTAEQYFTKANEIKPRFYPYEAAEFYGSYAICKKGLGDLTMAETFALKGLEYFMSMEHPPVKEWNKLCQEYASILIQMGKENDAKEWLDEMLPEE
ncbi:MAG: toll/interleukin-1 receptor domain-containing protein [Ruminococcus sp.]|nr:toll/interleukin-1 receptor domain-containing protein [Ruminococcus sp.]